MLYLEDYLEVIEHLPQELRDRFTELREMDLQVQNATDSIEERIDVFFSNCKNMTKSEKDIEYDAIRKDYYKTLEDADEKVNIATQMFELVDRYLRRIDQEIHKFKMELEADNAGITEILEKRSLELDQPQASSLNNIQKESYKTYPLQRTKKASHTTAQLGILEKKLPEKSSLERSPTTSQSSSTSNVSYTLGHMGAGGNAIAAAASQAIAATQQMQQGRRTASLKASYEAVNLGVHTQEFSIGKELAGAAQSAIAATQEVTKKQKKKTNATVAVPVEAPAVVIAKEQPIEDTTMDIGQDSVEWTYDPNEQRYCLCNQVSYGDMVACDNPVCTIEWFHYPCVGITQPPKGKWFCPQCAQSMKRRGSRK